MLLEWACFVGTGRPLATNMRTQVWGHLSCVQGQLQHPLRSEWFPSLWYFFSLGKKKKKKRRTPLMCILRVQSKVEGVFQMCSSLLQWGTQCKCCHRPWLHVQTVQGAIHSKSHSVTQWWKMHPTWCGEPRPVLTLPSLVLYSQREDTFTPSSRRRTTRAALYYHINTSQSNISMSRLHFSQGIFFF